MLGKGAVGRVFRGFSKKMGKFVAIKEINITEITLNEKPKLMVIMRRSLFVLFILLLIKILY
jgi:hypothetical protein